MRIYSTNDEQGPQAEVASHLQVGLHNERYFLLFMCYLCLACGSVAVLGFPVMLQTLNFRAPVSARVHRRSARTTPDCWPRSGRMSPLAPSLSFSGS